MEHCFFPGDFVQWNIGVVGIHLKQLAYVTNPITISKSIAQYEPQNNQTSFCPLFINGERHFTI